MTPESTILRYIKVRELALRGEEGETRNARILVAKMEQDHPTVREDTARFEARPKTASGEHAQQNASPVSSGGWGDIFSQAQTAWTTATDFARTVSQALNGSVLAQQCRVKSRMSTSRENVLVTVTIPGPVYEAVTSQLNAMQKNAFRQALHTAIDEEFNELF